MLVDIMHLSHADGDLTLDVKSSSKEVAFKDLRALWAAMIKSEIRGSYLLVIRKKVRGHRESGELVKVIGQVGSVGEIKVKFQSTPDSCFEAVLRGNRTDGVSLTGSNLLNKLRDHVGICWYNPDLPETVVQHEVHKPEMLVHVAEALQAAAVNKPGTVEVIAPAAKKPISRKFAQDGEATGLLFKELANIAVDWYVTVNCISSRITNLLSDPKNPCTLKVSGPIIRSLVNAGWLEGAGSLKGVGRYLITREAIQKFSLSIITPQHVVEVEQSRTQPVVPVPFEPITVTQVAPVAPVAQDATGMSIVQIITEMAAKMREFESDEKRLREIGSQMAELNREAETLRLKLRSIETVALKKAFSGLRAAMGITA